MRLRYQECLSKAMVIQTAVLCLFAVVSVFYVIAKGGTTFDYFYCIATVPFVCMPTIMSLLFRWRFSELLYTVFSLYAIGPLLGAVYGLYYVTGWWDDLLHALAGGIFAVCGAYLARFLNKNMTTSYVLCALFGVFVSMGIAVLWEIYEYTADLLLGSDMQADSVVNALVTKLGRTDGGVTVYENIQEVTVNGTPLGLGGYVDIGLHDTMLDMIMETLGALAYLVYALADREKHPMIRSVKTR